MHTFSNGPMINYAHLANRKGTHLTDLGVTMSTIAAFQDHISNSIDRASRMKLGWILHTFQTRDRTAMFNLWKALVIPIVNYSSQLWSPWSKTDSRNIESAQRTLNHSISEVRHVNCWKRLSHLKLYSLKMRKDE